MITIDQSQHPHILAYKSNARTLNPSNLGENESGWTITGVVYEDYYKWVNDFEATHPVYGKISGNYEDEITAETQEAYDHFVEHHPAEEWDYGDI